jgi:hypothetical protein
VLHPDVGYVGPVEGQRCELVPAPDGDKTFITNWRAHQAQVLQASLWDHIQNRQVVIRNIRSKEIHRDAIRITRHASAAKFIDPGDRSVQVGGLSHAGNRK